MSVQSDLKALANPQRATRLSGYFKTGPGQYGEGDIFWGIMVPGQREIAKKHGDTPLAELETLLQSPVHECRLTAVFILTMQYKKAPEEQKKTYYDFYLAHRARINNWDLIDLSAPSIVGSWLLTRPGERKILYTFARSAHLWERRIAVLSCFAFIKHKQFSDAFAIAELLLHDREDLIHKAVGWMLRELGKRDQAAEESFLAKHYKTMPRTMLRYAIERFSDDKRRFFMG